MKFSYKILIATFFILAIGSTQQVIKEARKTNSYTTFTFGSCNRIQPDSQSVIFSDIQQQYSDVFVWLGDASYVDKKIMPHIWTPNSEEGVKDKFDQAFNDPYYKEFRQTQKILGVYDDHDINQNDADKNNPTKEMARKQYLNFLEEPQDSPRWTNPNGIFESYYMGDKRIKMILLDVRFNRDTSNGDTLGEAQWQWLEKELQDENPFVFFIGSGLQVLPDDRITENFLPESKQRLIKLIAKYERRVVFLSGDIHIGEILEEPCSQEILGYPLYEITSSGLNLLKGDFMQLLQTIFEGILPNTFSQPHQRYYGLNYGKVSVEWSINLDESIVMVEVYGRGDIDTPVLKKAFYLGQMTTKEYDENQNIKCEVLERSKTIRFLERCISHLIEGNWIVWVFFVLISLNVILISSCMIFCCVSKYDEYKYKKYLEKRDKLLAEKKKLLQQQKEQQQQGQDKQQEQKDPAKKKQD